MSLNKSSAAEQNTVLAAASEVTMREPSAQPGFGLPRSRYIRLLP